MDTLSRSMWSTSLTIVKLVSLKGIYYIQGKLSINDLILRIYARWRLMGYN